jgi:hypothetical protein
MREVRNVRNLTIATGKGVSFDGEFAVSGGKVPKMRSMHRVHIGKVKMSGDTAAFTRHIRLGESAQNSGGGHWDDRNSVSGRASDGDLDGAGT